MNDIPAFVLLSKIVQSLDAIQDSVTNVFEAVEEGEAATWRVGRVEHNGYVMRTRFITRLDFTTTPERLKSNADSTQLPTP